MGQRRTGRWYSKHEKEILASLNLKPTPASGSGWLQKEDGYNDNILAQLKSTDKSSLILKLDDINKLEYHAAVQNKAPLFIVDFIAREAPYFLVRSTELALLYKLLLEDKPSSQTMSNTLQGMDILSPINSNSNIPQKVISSAKAKEEFYINKQQERRRDGFKK